MTELGIYELPIEVDAPGVVIVALPTITDEVNEFGPEMHCTLAYLGKMHEGHEFLMGSLQNALKAIAEHAAPFEASVSGHGHLGDEGAAILLLESEELTALQEAVTCAPAVATLSAMSEDKYPTWIPHLTVGGEDMDLDSMELPEEITFDAIALWAGEEKYTFMLSKLPVDIFDVDPGTIVDMDVVVVAAGLKGFTESLHPRGADGRFIPKFGIVKWLKNGHWQYGKVEGINKSPNGKDIDITATPSDLGGKTTGEPSVVLKPDQVYRAPVKIAHLPLGVDAGKDPKPGSPVKKVSGQAGSNPGGMYLIPTVGKTDSNDPKPFITDAITTQDVAFVNDNDTKYGPEGAALLAKLPIQPGDKVAFNSEFANGKPLTGEVTNVHVSPYFASPGDREIVYMVKPDGATKSQRVYVKLDGTAAQKLSLLSGEAAPEPVPAKFYVKHAKSDEKGRNEELANTLYADAGVAVPEVDYNPADGNIYSPVTEGKHDMDSRVMNKDQDWLNQVRKNFAVDAWLGNWDVFGLSADNIKTDENGTPWRIDNGGALLYRAQGQPKGSAFGSKVPELESMRTSHQGKKVYGKGLTKEQELDGAQRVLAISPGQIDDRVAEAGLPKSLADTLKARRKYLADYYGLPLPESIKPAETDQVATSAPLVDPADIALGKGKDRNWFPMSLVEAGFITQSGDKIAFPDDKQGTVGLDDEGHLLSTVAKQAQMLGWQQAWPQSTVLVHKNSTNKPRPNHDQFMAPGAMVEYRWQRGDLVEDTASGQQLAVLGTNNSTGAVLMQAVVPEGMDPTPAFLFDSWATNPTHKGFTVKRWDPPKIVAVPKIEKPTTPEPVKVPAPDMSVPNKQETLSDTSDAFDLSTLAPEMPSVPEGQAVAVSEKVKEDLVVPLPTGDGAPAKAKTTAVPGEKSMVLSDNTIAKPGNTVISKFGGEYLFVKPKGPYAVVTDPNSEDPTKLLTKKASTLFQLPGAEKADTGELAKPTLASGGLPVIGMIAKAKDGHEGEIVMISPDGKFVFITNAAGVKKRKSVGTVSAVSGPSAPKTAEKPPEEPELQDWEKELLAASSEVKAGTLGLSEYGEYKQLKDMSLKPGDKISKGDGYWWVVDYVGPFEIDVLSDDEEAMSTTFDKYGLNTYKMEPAVQPKIPAKLPDAEPLPVVPKSADLSDANQFGDLKPGDKLDIGGNSVTVVGYPMFQGSDSIVAAQAGNGSLVPLYLSGFKFSDEVTITPQPGFVLPEDSSDAFNELYDNAWHTPDLAAVEGVNGNASLSYLAVQAGLDPNADKWLAYDHDTGTFWDLTDDDGSGVAKKWDQDAKEWTVEPEDSNPIVQSKQPAIQNQIEPDPVAVETFTWTSLSGADYTFTKNQDGTWSGAGVGDYSEEEMSQYYGYEPAKVEVEPFVPPGNPGGDPDVSFNGYHPNSSDKVISLDTPTGAGVKTYWVQKEGGTEWYGVMSNGLNTAHPMQDKDIDNLVSLDGWHKNEEYGYDSNLADLANQLSQPDDTVIKTDTWPDKYQAGSDETIIKTEYGTWLTSGDGGQSWYEIDEDTGQTINVKWTPADLDDVSYDTYQQGDGSGGEPVQEPPAAEVLVPSGPPTAIDLEALKQLPDGYGLKNGKHVVATNYSGTGGIGTTYWESVTDKASYWKQILPDGTVGDKKIGTAKLPGWAKTELFNGNHQLVKDTQDGKVTPSGMPLSMVPYEPVDIATLPDPVQQFIIDNPGTGTLEIHRKDDSAPNLYYLVKPDGTVAEYKEAKGEVIDTGHLSAGLVPAWDAKVKNGTAEKLTFKDVTPTNSPVPAIDVEPAALDPAPAEDLQPPPIKIPGTSDHPATPNGYQLTPGQKVKTNSAGYWFVETDPGIYKMLNANGAGLNTFEYDESDWTDMAENGITITDYQVPGQPDATPADTTKAPDVGTVAPSVFDGYTAGPGDTVVMVPQAGSVTGLATHWVKPAGSSQWHKITNGGLDPMHVADDDTIDWSVTDLGGSTVYGTFSATPASVTPPAVTDPGALPKTMIDVNQYVLEDGGVVPASVGQELAELGGVPEGFTVHVYPYLDGTGTPGKYNANYGETYVVSNTGQAYYLQGGGQLSQANLPGNAKKLKIKAPTASPVAVNDLPQITGWVEKGLPDPATMPYLDTDKNSVVTVPDGGAWALMDNGVGDKMWVHMKPGTVDFSQGEYIKLDQIAGINTLTGETTDNPVPYTGSLFKITSNHQAWVDPTVLGQAGAPSATPAVSTPSAPPAPASEKPKWPGEKKPSAEDIASWGGMLTKDGHIPTVGMYVKRASMTGKILSVNKDKTKAVVLTSDGKKSLRQIDLLSVDAQENYQAYAPKSAPVDIPDGMPLAIDTIADALEKTAKDGNFRGLLPGQDGIRNGEMFVTSAKTPSGKKVNRVAFTLTKEYRAILNNMLSGKGEPVEKGDWAVTSKQSQNVAVGDQMSMRISSIKMPDGTDQWKPDTSNPPTHKVSSVGQPDPSNDGKFAVTMENLQDGSQITAYFVTDKGISVWNWDANKPKPKPVSGTMTLSAAAKAQGWTLTNPSNDGIISAVKGGAHGEGTLDVEPGKVVPISNSAFTGGGTGDAGYRPGGLRLVDPNGAVIEISSMDQGNNSFKGNVVITLPASAKAEQLNAALDKMGLAHKPLTQDQAKKNLLPLLRGMLDFDKSDIDTAKGYSAEQLFTKMGQQVGINDIGWQDVLVGVDESTGKTSYFWSERVRKAYVKKSSLKLAYRASSDGSSASIVSHVLYGTANAVTKRTSGMIYPPSGVGTGASPGSDSGNNAGHGSFMSASSSGTFHQSNAQASYVSSNMMVFTRPENIFGRIMDFRAHKSADAFGNPGSGANNVGVTMGSTIKDFQINGGLPAEATGLIAVTSKANRDTAIAQLKAMGITQVNGIPLEQYVVLKTSLGSKGVDDLPAFYLPANARPIMDLPVSYGMAAAA